MFKLLQLVFFSILVSACSLSPIKLDQTHTYQLNSVKVVKLTKYQRKTTLTVAMPTATPGYDSANMVYTDKAYQISHFANNHWVAPPAQMLQPLLVESLKGSGYFKGVVAAPTTLQSDLELHVNVLKLYQDFTKKHSKVYLSLQAQLLNKSGTLLLNQTWSKQVFAKANTPYAGVVAANQATQQLLLNITKKVLATLKR